MNVTRRSFLQVISAAIAGVVGTSAAARSKDVFRLPTGHGIEHGSVSIRFNAGKYFRDDPWHIGLVETLDGIRGNRVLYQIAGQVIFPVYEVMGNASTMAHIFLVDPNARMIVDYGHMPKFEASLIDGRWVFEPSVRATDSFKEGL